jgi:hypothetical protein
MGLVVGCDVPNITVVFIIVVVSISRAQRNGNDYNYENDCNDFDCPGPDAFIVEHSMSA